LIELTIRFVAVHESLLADFVVKRFSASGRSPLAFAGPLSWTQATRVPRGGLIFNFSAMSSVTDWMRKPI
jgi:hypothetical protein